MVGVAGFEPATSCSQSRRDNRATLHPESVNFNFKITIKKKSNFAESKGFEPLVQFPIRLFSKQVLSATQATLQYSMNVHLLSGCKCNLTLSILQLKRTFFEFFFIVLCKLTSYQRNTICVNHYYFYDVQVSNSRLKEIEYI